MIRIGDLEIETRDEDIAKRAYARYMSRDTRDRVVNASVFIDGKRIRIKRLK